jgi:hypothetical protein
MKSGRFEGYGALYDRSWREVDLPLADECAYSRPGTLATCWVRPMPDPARTWYKGPAARVRGKRWHGGGLYSGLPSSLFALSLPLHSSSFFVRNQNNFILFSPESRRRADILIRATPPTLFRNSFAWLQG